MTPNVHVPEWLRPGVSRALDFLPEAIVREMGRRLPGGFTKRPAILDQWRRAARGFQEVPPDFPDTLRESLPVYDVLQGLDPTQVGFTLPYLASLAGPDLLAVSLWLDLRPEVQALAQPELLTAPTPTSDQARVLWRQFIEARFLEPLDLSLPGLAPAPAPATPATPTPAEENELVRTRKWLADVRKQLTDAQSRHQDELQALRQEHAAAIQRLQQQRDALAARVQELETDSARQIRDEVTRALDAQVRPWHARAVAVEEHVGASGPTRDRLVHDLQAALERQRRADRHQSNLARLREELNGLLELREQAQQARADSLHPLGDWPTLLGRLDAAIVDLRRQLQDIPAAPPWTADLAAQIAEARTPADLDALLTRADHLARAGLLGAEVLAWLRQRAGERRSVLADKDLQRSAPAPVRLREILEGQAAGVLLIDAYNWIGRAGPILGVPTDPASFSESLGKLKPILKKLATRTPRTDILLFADGPREHSLDWAPNLRVIWSGGEGRNRADQVLRGHLKHLRQKAEVRPVWVISDDREVAGAARRWQAAIESAEAFARRIQSTQNSPAPSSDIPS